MKDQTRMYMDFGMPPATGVKGHGLVKPDPVLPNKPLRNGGIVRSERDGTAYVVSSHPVIHDWHQGTFTRVDKVVKGKAAVKAAKRARHDARRREQHGSKDGTD